VWIASAFCVTWSGAITDRASQAVAPYQYEAAARACQTISSTYSRNSWLIVSTAQELACTYGTGWHIELETFVQQHTAARAAEPSFRFEYPVTDVFFFIERKPLRSATLAASQPDPPAAGDADFARIERASIEYEASGILAAYANTHSDLRQIYADDSMAIYHASGSLASSDPKTLATN